MTPWFDSDRFVNWLMDIQIPIPEAKPPPTDFETTSAFLIESGRDYWPPRIVMALNAYYIMHEAFDLQSWFEEELQTHQMCYDVVWP
jgi:hypothetical protein